MDTIVNNALSDFMPKASNPVLSFIRVPWTVSLLLEWWPKMTISSILRMRANEMRPHSQPTVTLKMRNPIKGPVTLRSVGSDWSTFEEVVANEVYSGVAEHVSDCRPIVDLGANIGLTPKTDRNLEILLTAVRRLFRSFLHP